MSEINTIFAVIDPTTKNQRALNRAVLGVKSTGARLHAYLCIEARDDSEHLREFSEAETAGYEKWVGELVEPIRARGIKVDVEVERHEDWRSAIGPAATRAASDLIIKNAHALGDSRTRSLSHSDWSLFRGAPCSVMLAKSERSSHSGNVLLAVGPQELDAAHETMFEETLGFALAAVASYQHGALYVLSVNEQPEHNASPTELAQRTQVPKERVTVVEGNFKTEIERWAGEIDAELVVIGVSHSPRLSGILFRPTTEWLLNHLDRDVMVVIPKNE